MITTFIYVSVFYFITCKIYEFGLLDDSPYKWVCYVGIWEGFKKKIDIEKELREVEVIALKEGEGVISFPDKTWIQSIQLRLFDVNKEINTINRQYDEEKV